MVNRRELLKIGAVAPVLLARTPELLAAEYDLVIRGGRVIDPAQHIDRVADVAIRAGKIAAIKPDIAPSAAMETIDAKGKLVTPGLIDIHTHLADPAMTAASCLADGVTAQLDAGSRGADNIDEILTILKAAPNHVRALVNIARTGIIPKGELLDINNADARATAHTIESHRDWIVGIKARLSRYVAGENDMEALRRARQAADSQKVPIMLHVGDTAAPLPSILALLKRGDIITHTYSPPPHGIMDDNGKILPEVREARKRGVIFDIGNGRLGHLRWDIAESAMQQDFFPDTISSDMSVAGRSDQLFNFPNVLSKFLMLGMPLDRVIACATTNAAGTISAFKNFGTLRTGAAADVAVIELREGSFEVVDNYQNKRNAPRKLFTTAVVLGGKRVV